MLPLITQVSDALRRQLTPETMCDEASRNEVPEMEGLEDSYGANYTRCKFTIDYYSMQYSLYINAVVEIVGGIFFIITAAYIIRDKLKCDRYIAGKCSFEKECLHVRVSFGTELQNCFLF